MVFQNLRKIKRMSKKIKFNSIDINTEYLHPKPSIKDLPEWIKGMPAVSDGVETVKKCTPFLDAMSMGYTLYLTADILVDSFGIQQISTPLVVTSHKDSQTKLMDISSEYSKIAHKWTNFFVAKTPKGYSTLFTHPINRLDLPFHTLSGVVETDIFDLPVNLPFFIKKDFRGIITAGTPIAQAIPFKRIDWEHHVEDNKKVELPAYMHTMHNPPFGFYKKYFWKRKKYL